MAEKLSVEYFAISWTRAVEDVESLTLKLEQAKQRRDQALQELRLATEQHLDDLSEDV